MIKVFLENCSFFTTLLPTAAYHVVIHLMVKNASLTNTKERAVPCGKNLVQHRPTQCLHDSCTLLILRYETNFPHGTYYSKTGQKRMVFGRKSCSEALPGLQQKKQRYNAQLVCAMCQHCSQALWWRTNYLSAFALQNKGTNSERINFTWKTIDWQCCRWTLHVGVSYLWNTLPATKGLLFLHWGRD